MGVGGWVCVWVCVCVCVCVPFEIPCGLSGERPGAVFVFVFVLPKLDSGEEALLLTLLLSPSPALSHPPPSSFPAQIPPVGALKGFVMAGVVSLFFVCAREGRGGGDNFLQLGCFVLSRLFPRTSFA